MSPGQQAARSAIVEVLGRAGWLAPSNENEMFDAGMFVSREVALRYSLGRVVQTIFYRADQDALYLGLDMPDGRSIELMMRTDERLPEVLAVIVDFQDRVTETSYREPIRALIQAGVEVFASTDGDHFARIKDERPS